jgi:two-component system, NtrC family, sensor histidine kinase PilS
MLSQRQLLWVILGRLISATVILVSAAILHLYPTTLLGLNPAFFGLLFIYLVSCLYLTLALTDQHYPIQLRFQVVIDLLLITSLIYLSGEIYSPFNSLYLLAISYASLMLGKKTGYAIAASATICYVGLIDLSYLGFFALLSTNEPLHWVHFQMGLVVIGFFTVAVLSAVLSSRLKNTREELEARIHTLEDLQFFHTLVVESLRSGLITTDLSGKIRMANQYSQVLLGAPPERLAQKSLKEVFPGDFFSWWQEVSQTLLPSLFRNEFWIESSNEQKKYFGFSISPLSNRNQEIIGHVISFQDLTEIEQLRERLNQQERMSAIGRMAAVIAHEIRNPLASMHGAIQVLGRQFQPQESDARLMEIVLRESKRLNKFIEDFLAYARPRPLQIEFFELGVLIQETISLLDMHPLRRENHSILFTPPVEIIHMQGDADMLRQILWNLGLNALKAMPEGGRLYIRCALHESDRVLLEFQDEGRGMNQEEKGRLFEPFFSHFKQGLGIGMALVYQIVNMHQGEIRVESEAGQGTKIRIELPRLSTI